MLSIDEMKDVLLNGKNDAERDDAAEWLAEHYWQDARAQTALVEAMNSGLLDKSLKLTCAESLAEIWSKLGSVNQQLYELLDSEARDVVDRWRKNANPHNE